MKKDSFLKFAGIPLLGLVIPYLADLLTYNRYTALEILAAHIFFIVISQTIWYVCITLYSRWRNKFKYLANTWLRLATIAFATAVSGISTGFIFLSLWFLFSSEVFTITKLLNFSIYTSLAIILLTLLYEIIFLNNEKEYHKNLSLELDSELVKAETSILRNEIEPHFVLNSLITLNQLIKKDCDAALPYNKNLIEVYRYILKNKNKNVVKLNEELQFIQEYFKLLYISYPGKIQLEMNSDIDDFESYMIIPYALQILAENAVKYTSFTKEDPLNIKITVTKRSITVTNLLKPKPILFESTGTGLENLKQRFKFITRRELIVQKTLTHFKVILPLIPIEKLTPNDKFNYN